MRRRKWLQSVLTAPALAAAAASPQASAQQTSPATQARSADDPVKLPFASPEQVSGNGRQFFSDAQLATLTALCGQIMPAKNGRPGAVDAGVPAFLDFLLSQSPAARQTLYRTGLDRLSAESRRRFGKDFASANTGDAASVLAPLENSRKFEGSANPLEEHAGNGGRRDLVPGPLGGPRRPLPAFEEFLEAAKEDIFQATINSRAWADALSGRSRSASGIGQYYFTIE